MNRSIKITALLMILIMSLGACKKEIIEPVEEVFEYPSIKVINDLSGDWRHIKKVALVGYTFENILIEENGDSQTFKLDQGMPAGNEDIFVQVTFRRSSYQSFTRGIKINFEDGKTTTLKLSKCIGIPDCNEFYLEVI